MAYSCLQATCTSVADLLSNLETALVAFGWTLHDNVSSTKKVYKSNGEGADQPYGYIEIYIDGSNLKFRAYLYWDAGTHTGSVMAYENSSYNHILSQSPYVWTFCGNKDLVGIVQPRTLPGNTDVMLFGFIPQKFQPAQTNTTDAITAGSNVVVPVDSSTGFVAGRHYQLVGVNGEGRDWVEVSAIGDGTHMTIASLPRNYASGAYIMGIHAFGLVNDSARASFYPVCPRKRAGTENNISSDCLSLAGLLSYNWIDPDLGSDRYILTPLVFYEGSDAITGYSEDYFLFCPPKTFGDIYGVTSTGNPLSSGSVDAWTEDTLTDNDKTWVVNEFADKIVVIASGTGVGQTRKIVSNTDVELTLNSNWVTNPGLDSTYYIVDEAYRVLYSSMFANHCMREIL